MAESNNIYGYDPYKARPTYDNVICSGKDFINNIQMFDNNGKIGAMNIICNSGKSKTLGNPKFIREDKNKQTSCNKGYTTIDIYSTQDNPEDNYLSGLGFECDGNYVVNSQNCVKTDTFKCKQGILRGIEVLYNQDSIKTTRFLCDGDKFDKSKLLLPCCGEKTESLTNYGISFAIFVVVILLAVAIVLFLPDRAVKSRTKL